MTLNRCPVCGHEPHESVTVAGHTAIRCDGQPAGGYPRHTILVQDPSADDARRLWAMIAKDTQ